MSTPPADLRDARPRRTVRVHPHPRSLLTMFDAERVAIVEMVPRPALYVVRDDDDKAES